ncbi:hypothetical protein PS726_01949 [Pseudomonas fluorescens]|uniref:Uncharacterized protein n=1 Tax=Pseudomonas fluorescens TaxID=294 RepID=A0A8H2RQZ5_PSEFL|nr:hypothetical protein [Pseudomonas fluorescens]CAG8873514.1 hypothetical protein PS861_06033 [Pseudomonas fluorescens]VVN92036.1 hypothetical protein PS726_01949 [Pseudomonas fluorescens]VVO74132.1 hypothetical protein PS900_01463 [Pseudomonas fluorescens]
MSAFLTSGVYLQRVESLDETQITLSIIRNIDRTTSSQVDYFKDSTPMILHVRENGRSLTLDFDPWSDINVTSDNHIDQKDIDALTLLGAAYYHQSTIGPENGAFLRFLSTDAPYFRVIIEKWELSEPPRPLNTFFAFDTEIFEAGSPFEITTDEPETGYQVRVGDDLQNLAKAFTQLTL